MIKGKVCWAVVVAAGKGTRTGLPYNKAFCKLRGVSVLGRSLSAVEKCGLIDGVVVVISRGDEAEYQKLINDEGAGKLARLLAFGGSTRQASVYNGLKALPKNVDIVAIHDAARAFVPDGVIKGTIEAAFEHGSGVAATRVVDTVKVVDYMDRAIETIDRTRLRAVQTPQTFSFGDILRAHEMAAADEFLATDDAALYEKYIGKSHLVVTDEGIKNVKLTTGEDLRMVLSDTPAVTRVGFGFDAHRLIEGRRLVLCGVEIPFDKGLEGHSDADCAVHALMDALLSCAGLGDIGRMFPDSDDEYKDIYSIILLKRVMSEIDKRGIELVNADVTIIAQRPKLLSFMPEMRKTLARAMNVGEDRVNVKATTTERMGYEGRGEGISACAVALIRYR